VTAAALAALALAYLYVGREYALDSLASPGPGVFPLAAGLALLLLAGCQAIVDIAHRPRGDANGGARRPPRRRAPLVMAVLLSAYAACVPLLGFLGASAGLVVAAAKLMGVEGVWRPVLLGAAIAIAVHLVFVAWLGIPLPTGRLR
jgi:hypothetical protein